MKEFPIIFSTPMVQAILEGRKIMTRRICKHQFWSYSEITDVNKNGIYQKIDRNVSCPYGQPGDLLWVRETVRLGAWREDGRMAFDYKASPELVNTPWVRFEDDHDGKKFENLHIRVCDELNKKGFTTDRDGNYHWAPGKSPLKWMPSIHMPKAAARIWLQVKEVRIERLHDITDQDAIAEGIYAKPGLVSKIILYEKFVSEMEARINGLFTESAIECFQSLWSKINGQTSWYSNPWVWVISFEVISTTGKPDLRQSANTKI